MPKRRKYLPYALTAREKRSPKLRRKLSRCIKKVEKAQCPKRALRKDGTYNYARCKVNPVAICRATLARAK
uniref:Uncharacterized protein n=1 Tax=viral metagenome TaxID=1070528 RepID=A0A6M3LVV0_9ZZZZ